MIKMRMSYHASVERIDRLTSLVQRLGFNEIAYETVDSQNPEHIISITDTGIILIRGRQDGTLVTGYMGTIDKVTAICHGNVPIVLKRTVVRNCKKYAFLLNI